VPLGVSHDAVLVLHPYLILGFPGKYHFAPHAYRLIWAQQVKLATRKTTFVAQRGLVQQTAGLIHVHGRGSIAVNELRERHS